LVTRGPATAEVKVYLTPEMEKNLDARLARIEGHVRSIRRMLAEHQDCDSLLIQMAAVKAAMNQAIIKLLEGHIETCVSECVATEEGIQALDGLKRALGIVLKST
jgi:DNA-binding FrmR family transcriptional regulator